MKIFSAEVIRQWDQYTIANEPIASIDLMERAASQCVKWLEENEYTGKRFVIFCGKGNNGGDGLAIARMLLEKEYDVIVYILELNHKGSSDFQANLAKLEKLPIDILPIQTEKNFPSFAEGDIIIDALWGSGLDRPLDGIAIQLVEQINESGCEIISIDVPSGLFVDRSSKGNTIIKATHVLSFQTYKLAFLVAENAAFAGQIHILDISLHTGFYKSANTDYELIDDIIIKSIYKPRKKFAHKGNFGHSLIVAGSYGKMGAAVLAAKACLHSGAGLLTCHIPKCGYDIMQSSVPEAMVMTDFNSSFLTKIEDDIKKYDAVGIGPGIGGASETKTLIKDVFDNYHHPVVIDADALNIIAAQKYLLRPIPPQSIITPHPKEFERLFGETANDFDKIEMAIHKAKELNIIIVLKGHHTLIATPEGKIFFNSTGNAGMAKGGSGDVLTGILTALLSQGYNSIETAILGVYLHGLAGDIAAKEFSMEAMTATDIIKNLGEAFKNINPITA
ncbi:MAG: NAD(P)H-hydrate dehydratase [Chitinophagaceae bacterium]